MDMGPAPALTTNVLRIKLAFASIILEIAVRNASPGGWMRNKSAHKHTDERATRYVDIVNEQALWFAI